MAKINVYGIASGTLNSATLTDVFLANNLGGAAGSSVNTITLVNTDTAPVTVNVVYFLRTWVVGTNAPVYLCEKDKIIAPGDSLVINYEITFDPGDRILMSASTTGKVKYKLNGKEITKI